MPNTIENTEKETEPKKITLENGCTAIIRDAVPDDAEAVLALKMDILRQGIYDALLSEEYTFDVAQEALWIEHSLTSSNNFMVVATIDDNIVGVLYFQISHEIRCNHWGEFGMGINKSSRGLGIGTAMLEALFKWGEIHPKLEKICLKVFDVNPKAHKLYQRLGFIEEGRLKKCLKMGSGVYSDAILMAKFINKKKSGT